MDTRVRKSQVRLFVLPEYHPCGPGSSCCGPVGQSKEVVAEISKAIRSELDAAVEIVDVGDRREVKDGPAGPKVRHILSSLGAQALPIVALDGEVVGMGNPSPHYVIAAIKRAGG